MHLLSSYFFCFPFSSDFSEYLTLPLHRHSESLGSSTGQWQPSAYHILKLLLKNTSGLIGSKCCSVYQCFNLQLILKNSKNHLSQPRLVEPQWFLTVGQGRKAAGDKECKFLFMIVQLESGTWDHLMLVTPQPECVCSAAKIASEIFLC